MNERGKDTTSTCIQRFNPETKSVEPQRKSAEAAFGLLKPLMKMSVSDLIVQSWTTKNLSNTRSLCITHCRRDPLKLQSVCVSLVCLNQPITGRCLSTLSACHSYALTSTELRFSHSNESPACFSESCVWNIMGWNNRWNLWDRCETGDAAFLGFLALSSSTCWSNAPGALPRWLLFLRS